MKQITQFVLEGENLTLKNYSTLLLRSEEQWDDVIISFNPMNKIRNEWYRNFIAQSSILSGIFAYWKKNWKFIETERL